jgi:hypothetical protein
MTGQTQNQPTKKNRSLLVAIRSIVLPCFSPIHIRIFDGKHSTHWGDFSKRRISCVASVSDSANIWCNYFRYSSQAQEKARD